MLKQVLTHFGSLSMDCQQQLVRDVHCYLDNKFMKFTFTPSKFVYRENAIVDLGNISELAFHLLTNTIEVDSGNAHSVTTFGLVIDLALKISKSTVINFNTFLLHYCENEVVYLRLLLEQGGVQGAGELLKLYAMVGLADPGRLQRLEQAMLSQLDNSGENSDKEGKVHNKDNKQKGETHQLSL